jgi:hypothetical protein
MSIMTPEPEHCARCRRLAPDQTSDEFLEWEALGETGEEVICPGCLTLGEERALGDDALETHAEGLRLLADEAESHTDSRRAPVDAEAAPPIDND